MYSFLRPYPFAAVGRLLKLGLVEQFQGDWRAASILSRTALSKWSFDLAMAFSKSVHHSASDAFVMASLAN